MDVTRERIGCIFELREILLSFQMGFNLVSAAVEEDSTSGLVIEAFDDSDMVGADVVLLHGCPCMFVNHGPSQRRSKGEYKSWK